jgi:HSP20 family protein
MALIPWKPFSDLDHFFEDEDWMMPIFSKKEMVRPAMDIYETEKEVIAEVSLPKVDPEKVEVSLEDGILRVSGGEQEIKEEKEKGYWKKEIRKGSFERMIRLPIPVKEDSIDAAYEKGVLKIVMQKAGPKPASKVKIKVK